MAKATKAAIETKFHEDGAVSHKITFANGVTRVVLVKKDTPLYQHHLAHSSKSKILAAINSVEGIEKAVEKVDLLEEAWDEGKWGLQNESDGTPKVGSLARAFAAVRGVSLEKADRYIKSLTRAEQATLRKAERIAYELAKLDNTDGKGKDLLNVDLGDDEDEKAEAA